MKQEILIQSLFKFDNTQNVNFHSTDFTRQKNLSKPKRIIVKLDF